MGEIRQAKKKEIEPQKEIWKLCFGDQDAYIDTYYADRYKEEETMLLFQKDELSAMLTMISASMITSDGRSFPTVMFYGIATHPKFQKKGFATELIKFAEDHLIQHNKVISVLVPAEKKLFDFYAKLGYERAFFIREFSYSRDMVDKLSANSPNQCVISPVAAEDYNIRRNKFLTGKLYIKYKDEDIIYQKRLSQHAEGDIVAIDYEELRGCAAIEKISSDKILIKEILLPEELFCTVLKQIIQLYPAKEYLVRTPAYFGANLGGVIRSFGMIKIHKELDLEITPQDMGYLGLAFD